MGGIDITCIAGLVQDGTVYLAGDSATTRGNRRIIKKKTKVVKRGEFVMGGAGHSVMAQLMHYVTTLPPVFENQGCFDYMVNTFLPLFRKAVKEAGQMTIKDSLESTESEFLIGFRGHLFSIGCDMNVNECIDGYDAIGSGEEFALGVIYATKDSELKPEERLIQALECAAYHQHYVYPPFEVESVSYTPDTVPPLNTILDKANEMMGEEDG
jgi:ATP-dependent protease HslVU (ClpYQ) peptidase subunit